MSIVTLQPETRFLLRPGPTDHKLLDSLLTEGMLQNAVNLDGIVLDAPHSHFFVEARDRLNRSATVLVEPQAYRFQATSYQEHPRLVALGYCRPDRALEWEDFRNSVFAHDFVKSVLDVQQRLRPTHYLAPAFYVAQPDSPWQVVNQLLLRETIAQVGSRVYATLCGSYAAMCRTPELQAGTVQAIPAEVEGVYIMVSPFSAYDSSSTKLTNFRLPNDWQREEFREHLLRARRLADRVVRDIPQVSRDRFRHLDTWDKSFTELPASTRQGVRA